MVRHQGIAAAFSKLRIGEDLSKKEREALKSFVDMFITVSTHKSIVGEDVANIALEVQRHRCTACCRKYTDECRFHYPKLPSPETIIAKPLKDIGSERKKKVEKFNKTIEEVKAIIRDEETVFNIMKKYDKQTEVPGEDYEINRKKRIQEVLKLAKVSMKDYLEALGYSKQGCTIVLERDLDEILVNPFNTEWLRAHNGNMDLQVCLDFFSVVTYITDYLCKSDDQLCDSIKSIMKNAKDQSLQERMKTLANAFVTHRSMGEAEAIVKIIPSLNLANSNVTCQWVNIDYESEKSTRWRKATQKEMESGIPVVQLENHEGYWYEQQDFYSKYLRRPDELRSLCFAQFAKMYKSRRVQEKEAGVEYEELDEELDMKPEEEDFDDVKFNFVMTFRNEGLNGTQLPSMIFLKDPQPGECSSLTRRKYPAALRFRKIREANDPVKYMYGELKLYHPHTKELNIENIVDLYNENYGKERKVDIVKSQVMEFLVDVMEARHFVDQAEKQQDLDDIATQMDPNNEQDNEDCDDLEAEEHPDYLHANPDSLELQDTLVTKGLFKRIEIPNYGELKQNSRALDEYQKEVLNIGIKYAKDCVKARRENNKPPTPPLLMVSGGAGSGKSTVIKTLSHWAQKILQKEGDEVDAPCVVKTSFCGTAASLIDGQTLHSAFSFNYGNKNLSLPDKSKMMRQKMLQNLKILIIDEISMVKSDILYMLDFRLKEITGKMNVPFGGIAIFVFGDMMQLRPIMGNWVFQEPRNPDLAPMKLSEDDLEGRLWPKFQSIILEKNHRQGDDKTYADILNRVRIESHTDEDVKILKSRERSNNHEDLKNVDFCICCKRNDVYERNSGYLAKLPGKAFKFKATHINAVKKEFKPKIRSDGTVEETGFMNVLLLKKDAKVLLIHNINTMDGLTNGQMGTLEDLVMTKSGEVDMLVVKFRRPGIGASTRQKYPTLAKKYPDCSFIERISFSYNLRKNSVTGASATIIQFPIILAYAVTVHKIQGGSIPTPLKVAMDIKGVFKGQGGEAQAYVMMSRVQTIDQIFFIEKFVEKNIRVSTAALKETKRLEQISLNTNRSLWNTSQKENLKVASLNCRGLSANFEDIKADHKLLKADVIMLQEISISTATQEDFKIDGFQCKILPNGIGKGIALYVRQDVQFEEEIYTASDLQLATVSHKGAKIVNVYRSNQGSLTELRKVFDNLLSSAHHGVVIGDFNLCAQMQKNNHVTTGLKKIGFIQKVTDPTHIQGRIIDHCYVKENEEFKMKDLTLYSPYYTDHDAILVVFETSATNKSRLSRKRKKDNTEEISTRKPIKRTKASR